MFSDPDNVEALEEVQDAANELQTTTDMYMGYSTAKAVISFVKSMKWLSGMSSACLLFAYGYWKSLVLRIHRGLPQVPS